MPVYHLWNLRSERLEEAAPILTGTCLVLAKYHELLFSPLRAPLPAQEMSHFDPLL